MCTTGCNFVSHGCNRVSHRRALFPVLDLFNHRSGARSKLARRGEVWQLTSRDEYAEGEQVCPTYYLLPTTYYLLPTTDYLLPTTLTTDYVLLTTYT